MDELPVLVAVLAGHTTAAPGPPANARLLEDGTPRLLEDGTDRLLKS